MTGRSKDIGAGLLLLCIGLVVRVNVINHSGFNGLYGQDAYAYYDFAQAIHAFVTEQTPLPQFYWPVGYPLLIWLGQQIFSPAVWMAQLINIWLGALCGVLLYIAARQFGLGVVGAFLGGLALSVSGQLMQSSVVIMTDVPALALSLIALTTMLQYRKSGKAVWLLIASGAIAWAGIMRWIYWIIWLPLGMIWLWRIYETHTFSWRAIGLSGTVVLVVVLPQVLYMSYSTTSSPNHPHLQAWSPSNWFKSSFDHIDGHFDYAQVNAVFYGRSFWDSGEFYLSPLLGGLAIIGCIYALKRHKFLLLISIIWALPPYLFLAGIPYQNIRFGLILAPIAALLVSAGIHAIFQYRQRHIAAGLLLVIPLVGIAHTYSHGIQTAQNFVQYHMREKAIAMSLAAYIPPEAEVYVFGLTLILQHETPLNIYELYYETSETLAATLTDENAYLLVNVWVIENQWRGKPLQDTYYWLRDEVGLDIVARNGNYTLFRIRAGAGQ